MNSKELRIGNWVEWNGIVENKIRTPEVHQIGTISRNAVRFFDENSSSFRLYRIKPIPLTNEWILKLGFLYNSVISTYNLYIDSELRFILEMDVTKSVFKVYWRGIDIVHVHQLQNLYFALTQTELLLAI